MLGASGIALVSDSSVVTSTKPRQSGDHESGSDKKLIWWVLIFAFGAGATTAARVHHLRAPHDGEWLFDLVVGLPCFIFARFYALRLLERVREKDSIRIASR